MESQGFVVDKLFGFNKAGTPPWWAYSKLMHSRTINKPVLKIFDKSVWVWRRLDGLMPWPALSLIVVARKPSAAVNLSPAKPLARCLLPMPVDPQAAHSRAC